jgi:hypothetical protein
MRQLPLTSQAADLLARPNPSTIAWLRPNGAPYSTATWYIVDGEEHILVNTNSSRRRSKISATIRASPSPPSPTRIGTRTCLWWGPSTRCGTTRTWPTSTASHATTPASSSATVKALGQASRSRSIAGTPGRAAPWCKRLIQTPSSASTLIAVGELPAADHRPHGGGQESATAQRKSGGSL